MKLRIGFVSNSSSSSFCLGKAHLTDEQIEKFSDFVALQPERHETYLQEEKHYFVGSVSYHDDDSVKLILDAIGIDKEYILFYD